MWEQNWSDSQRVPLKYENNKERKTHRKKLHGNGCHFTNKCCTVWIENENFMWFDRSISICFCPLLFVHSSVQFALQSCLLFSTFLRPPPTKLERFQFSFPRCARKWWLSCTKWRINQHTITNKQIDRCSNRSAICSAFFEWTIKI